MALILPFGGKVPRIAPDAFIADNATIIGDVTIGAGSSVWFGCVLRGDTNFIRVGSRTNLQDGTVVHVARTEDGPGQGQGVAIGDNVLIGHMAMIHACTIGNGALIGMTACILDEAVVEDGAMVAAGSLVAPRKVVKSGELWAGRPAKLIRQMSPEEILYLTSGVDHYCELAQEYRAQQEKLR